MKIPKSLNIFSVVYNIIIEKGYFESSDGSLLRGECDQNNKVIRLTKIEKVNMFQTLIHESIHAVAFEMDLYDNEHNEKFVDSLALGITDMLIRNKLLKDLD